MRYTPDNNRAANISHIIDDFIVHRLRLRVIYVNSRCTALTKPHIVAIHYKAVTVRWTFSYHRNDQDKRDRGGGVVCERSKASNTKRVIMLLISVLRILYIMNILICEPRTKPNAMPPFYQASVSSFIFPLR